MGVALRKPLIARGGFLDWVQTPDSRYEFDGIAPVAMVGGTTNHSRIAQNIYPAAFAQLQGSPYEPFVQDGGVATVGDVVRYSDVVITCTVTPGESRLIPDQVVVFEVLGPSTSLTDRITKLDEYRAVPSILTYVVIEPDAMALTVHRRDTEDRWVTSVLKAGDVLTLEAPQLELLVAACYERVTFPASPAAEVADRQPG